MKTKEQIEGMLRGTESELINMSPLKNKKKRVEQDGLRGNLQIQLSVLKWVLADNPPAASAATTMEAASSAVTMEKQDGKENKGEKETGKEETDIRDR